MSTQNKNFKLAYFSIAVLIMLLTGGYFLVSKVGSKGSYDISSIKNKSDLYPTIVIGGGVGGLTASVYLSMANIKTYLAEGDMPGGLLTQSLSVRNWPGEIDTPGSIVTDKLRAQARKRGVEIAQELVTDIDTSKWPYEVTLSSVTNPDEKKVMKALSVIIGMGAKSNYLGIPGEQEYWSKGVTNCAVCEGSLYRDKTVCVVGGGDSAMEEASYLSGLAKKVYIFVRRDALRAVDSRKDEVLKKPNVEVVYNSSLIKILGNNSEVTEILVRNNKTNEKKKYQMDGVFLAIGFTPNTEIFKNKLALTSGGYIKLSTDQESSKTGIYAVGDIVDPVYKQAVTAAGDGCRAALQTQRFLGDIGFDPADFSNEEKPAASGPEEHDLVAEPVAGHENHENKDNKKQAQSADSEKSQKAEKKTSEIKSGILHDVKSKKEFDQIMQNTKLPVVIDYYATWCGPCKIIAPLYKKLSKLYKDKVLFLKINIDTVPLLAQEQNIRGVPTFTFHSIDKNNSGKLFEADRVIGAGLNQKEFKEKLDAL